MPQGASPAVVGVFGLVGFGLGHMVISDAKWALLFLGVDAVLFGAGALIGLLTGPALLPLGAVLWVVLHVPQALDAYLKAETDSGFLHFAPDPVRGNTSPAGAAPIFRVAF
jgi:hypothetical protein